MTKTGTPQELAPAQAVPFAPGTSIDMYLIGSTIPSIDSTPDALLGTLAPIAADLTAQYQTAFPRQPDRDLGNDHPRRVRNAVDRADTARVSGATDLRSRR